MLNTPEAEARMLLSRPLHCEGAFTWISRRKGREGRSLSAGVLDETGLATNMFVQFTYMHKTKSAKTRYLFSVFIRYRYGTQRVYQLEVVQELRHTKDAHGKSHEHIGDLRLIGHARWQRWSYHEVLAYFCAQTNITFDPFPPSP